METEPTPLASPETQLVEDITAFVDDPLGFVNYVFPWGKAGTALAKSKGPRTWQREYLDNLGKRLRRGDALKMAIQEATASGHGIGKSTLVSWLVLWAMSTHEDTRGVVTANTDTQLRTKTWPELSKWHRLSANRSWFNLTATAIFSSMVQHEKTWRIDIIPWSESNTEAFAGLHNQGKRLLLVYDEASAIPNAIWEVSEGALTDEDTEIIWAVFGNPTRNTGRFRECFGRRRHRWGTRQIDSRDVEGTNKEQLAAYVEDYGEDSDFCRVRVRGVFPRASDMQLIPGDAVSEAMQREVQLLVDDPLIMGVDVARGGDDRNVIRYRRGRCGRPLPGAVPPTLKIPGEETRDSNRLISVLVEQIRIHKPDAVFVDGTGIGGPICDRLRQMGYPVIEIQFGGASPDPHCANMRAYMWLRMKDWIIAGGAIEDDPDLEQDLISPEYGHDRHDRLQLETKEHMKDIRGLASPDDGDSLGLTFAQPVAPLTAGRERRPVPRPDYDPFAEA